MTTAVTSPETGGEGRHRDRPNDVLMDMLLRLGQFSLHLDPTRLGETPPSPNAPVRRLHSVFTLSWSSSPRATDHSIAKRGASCSYVSLCDKMKTGATASSRDPGGWCSIGTNLACWPAPGNRLHLRGTLRRVCQTPFALLAALAM